MSVKLQLLTADESELLVRGIEAVYGDTYPIPEFYDARYLHDAIKAGQLHTVVALHKGQVVGCMSTVLEEEGDITADGSALMIAPDYRGQGIVGRIGGKMVEVYQRLGLSGLHLYALALHDRVQNQSGAAGAVVSGALPAWFSRDARIAGYAFPDLRIGAVPLYMPLAALPARTVYLPAPYERVLGDIYNALVAERDCLSCPAAAVMPAASTYYLEVKTSNLQRRILLFAVGADLADVLEQQLVLHSANKEQVLYIDIPLSDPAAKVAVDVARAAGFFFAALMVDRRGCDRLRLQRYDSALAAPEHMVLASSAARRLLDFVLEDSALVGH